MAPSTLVAELLARDRFPGMDADEADVFRDWLRECGDLYDRFEFNVRLGSGGPVALDDSESTRRMWDALTKYRADVIAWCGADADVLELKVNAKPEAVTQVRRYADLVRLEYAHVGRAVPVIVCRTSTTTVDAAMHVAGGHVWKVTPPASR